MYAISRVIPFDASGRADYCSRVRILGLLNSNIHGGDARLAEDVLFPSRMRGPLAAALGEPVEITAKVAWPTANLPRVAARWVSEIHPELIVFPISSFWFLYESVPVRLERELGLVGRFIAAGSLKAAATPWLAHNSPFQSFRRGVQRRVGGKSYFEPAQVIDVATATIRSLVREERAYLVVIGPSGGDDWATDAPSARRIEARRAQVDDAMAKLCRSLHVEYWDGSAMSRMRGMQPRSLQGDRLHLDAEGHRRTAEQFLDPIAALCRRAQAHAGGVSSRALAPTAYDIQGRSERALSQPPRQGR